MAANAALCADGVNGVGARAAGLDGGRDYGVALEANVPYGVVSRERYQGRLCPRAGQRARRLRLGLSQGRPRQRRRRRLGARGAAAARAPRPLLPRVLDPRVRPRGRARLPAAPHSPARASNKRAACALLGDAAGLVDPLSGDGIYEAFLSAKLAAGATLEVLAGATRDFGRYEHDLGRALSSQLAAAWGAKVALDRFPRLTYAVVRSPFLWKAIESLIGGDVPSPSAMRGLRRASMRIIEAIARAAGNPGRAYRTAHT